MGQAGAPQPVKLIVGMLASQESCFAWAQDQMEKHWGTIDITSEVMPFDYTDYYAREMGERLLRKFVSFAELIDPGELAAVKHQSNALESEIDGWAENQGQQPKAKRLINLDPGYIEPSKLVLATTKNYSHRIYIGQSMYAEATLRYQKGRWQGWPYTYPDYASGAYDEFLNRVRERLMEKLSSQK